MCVPALRPPLPIYRTETSFCSNRKPGSSAQLPHQQAHKRRVHSSTEMHVHRKIDVHVSVNLVYCVNIKNLSAAELEKALAPKSGSDIRPCRRGRRTNWFKNS